ncbi:hypothetical protein AVEN_49928-1 [Araneus ventricosus]|uniref:Uncharacterized protein n=1 Tax=Araneus ventricosus TaxID=182803 RepID=A0A4Y2HLE0_ARAVE|nr:hypothetical protein AVEN_49928-1 [Araneus ventricosus]
MKSLSGLDNVIAEGLDSMTNLLGMANKIFEPSELKQVSLKIKKALCYLKLGHKLHCSSDSCQGIASHCPLFAISDKNDVDFRQICEYYNDHSLICPECMDIFELLHFIKQKVLRIENEDFQIELLYDLQCIHNSLLNWMKHTIRDVQQTNAKIFAVSKLTSKTALWIKDWAQKIIPIKFRESQREYFGKKGMSLHIDVLLFKSDDTLQKQVHFTILERSDQGLEHTLSVLEHVAKQVKTDFPTIRHSFMKSDNAGCYSRNGHIQLEIQILKKI